jgi:hypothetical protein
VDLNDPHNTGKSRNTRFLNRVFTADEKRQIFNAAPVHPDIILWSLWAGKETAYKVISKDNPTVSSVPRLYEVSLFQGCDFKEQVSPSFSNTRCDGFVDTPGNRVYIRVCIHRDYVHCIGNSCSAETLDSMVWHVDTVGPDIYPPMADSSVLVRVALKKHLASHYNIRPEQIDIKREKTLKGGLGPPFIYLNGRQADIDISLSHDGQRTAYAFILKDLKQPNFSS